MVINDVLKKKENLWAPSAKAKPPPSRRITPQASRPWNNDDADNEDQDEGSDEGDNENQDEGSDEGDNDVKIMMMMMSGKLDDDDDDDDYGEWQAWTTGQVRRG